MTHRVFVYGTLKEGFPNFHVNRGTRVPGEFVTVDAFPMYVIGRCAVPWLVDRTGEGHVVRGQLFEVDDATLAAMDELEMVSVPGWYARRSVRVRPAGASSAGFVDAFVYFGSADRLAAVVVHRGPIAEYTLADAADYADGDL
jgi:gamma-glutamylaminecyclotransferase